MPDSPPIRDFWHWFESNVDRITVAYDRSNTDWLRDNISPQVKRLGHPLNWEMGPYHAAARTFVISPTVRENLPLTRSIVASAPMLNGWHFLHAKPAKELLTLEFNANGHSINADNWHYQLTAYDGGEFVDIDLYLDGAIPDDKMFCELVVEALLGEERRLDQVGHVTPHLADSVAVPDNLTPIRYLKEHVDDVLCPEREA
jgi:hypothetical protein